jgi:hypothetical protein
VFKKEFLSHLLFVVIWLFIVTLLRWSWHLNLIWLCLGGLVGAFLLDIDHLIYFLVANPHELTSQRVKRLLDQRRFKEALFLMAETRLERPKLALHNALFQIIIYVLAFFVLTSTNNLFGAGLVMGLALHLLKDEFQDLINNEEHLRTWLFWQFKFEVSLQEQKIYLAIMVLLFLSLSWLLI